MSVNVNSPFQLLRPNICDWFLFLTSCIQSIRKWYQHYLQIMSLIWWFLPTPTFTPLTVAIISRLGYYCSLLTGFSPSTPSLSQPKLHTATKMNLLKSKSDHVSALLRTLPGFPESLNESQNPTGPGSHLSPLWPHILPLFPSLPLPQPQWTLYCSSNTLAPSLKDLCTCCSFLLESLYTAIHLCACSPAHLLSLCWDISSLLGYHHHLIPVIPFPFPMPLLCSVLPVSLVIMRHTLHFLVHCLLLLA